MYTTLICSRKVTADWFAGLSAEVVEKKFKIPFSVINWKQNWSLDQSIFQRYSDHVETGFTLLRILKVILEWDPKKGKKLWKHTSYAMLSRGIP